MASQAIAQAAANRVGREGQRLSSRGDRDRMQDRKEELQKGRMKTQAGRNQQFGRTVQGGNYTPGY